MSDLGSGIRRRDSLSIRSRVPSVFLPLNKIGYFSLEKDFISPPFLSTYAEDPGPRLSMMIDENLTAFFSVL